MVLQRIPKKQHPNLLEHHQLKSIFLPKYNYPRNQLLLLPNQPNNHFDYKHTNQHLYHYMGSLLNAKTQIRPLQFHLSF
jgi:hypothetical protein